MEPRTIRVRVPEHRARIDYLVNVEDILVGY